MKRPRIGEMLMGNGIITQGQLDEALEIQKHNGGLLGMILINLKYIQPEVLSIYLKAQNNDK